jgi:3',5'-cyclic-AMP phosphodiesterase
MARYRFSGLAAAAFAAMLVLLVLSAAPEPDSFRFAVLGDRTGEPVAGVYDRVWRDAAAESPAFVVSVGDTIQGLNDETAEAEWMRVKQTISSWSRFPLYLAPGNHDIWSERSEKLFRKYSGHAPHYSFDYRQAHFTILDNSRSDQLSAAELTFLEEDLKAHQQQPLKFIVSHRPSWLLNAVLGDPNFALHQIAMKYGARYVIAGHLHEMLRAELEGVTYISMVSSGGHLRGSGKYEEGWFFGYVVVDVSGRDAEFRIHELAAPYGKGRSTRLSDWGKAGLQVR